jgi:hypothetical protein
MSATATEAYLGQRSTGKSAERPWIIKSASSDSDARTALLAAAPTTLGTMNRIDADCEVEEIDSAGGIYTGRVVYATSESAPKPPNTFHVSFDISGQTVKIKRSLNTFYSTQLLGRSHRRSTTADDQRQPGRDRRGHRHRRPDDDVSGGVHVRRVGRHPGLDQHRSRSLVGCVNDATFLGYDEGELLLTRISGQKRDDGNYDITFGFAVSKNSYNLKLRGEKRRHRSQSSHEKRGWDYLWFSQIDQRGRDQSRHPHGSARRRTSSRFTTTMTSDCWGSNGHSQSQSRPGDEHPGERVQRVRRGRGASQRIHWL